MKRIITIALTLLLITTGQILAQGFTIHGTVEGVNEGTVTLQARGGGKFTTGVENGKFTLTGKITNPTIHILRIEGVRGSCQIFLDNSDVTFVANTVNLRNSTVSGSATHDVFTEYVKLGEDLSEKFKPLSTAYSEARKVNDKVKMKELEDKFDGARLEALDATEEFVLKHRKSPVAAFVIMSNAANYDDPVRLENTIKKLDKSLSDDPSFMTAVETMLVAKKTAIGQPAIDFTMNDPDGKPVKLSDLKGQVVLLDFWAAWCRPCRAENPNVVAAYKKYNSKGFTVMGVSLDRDKKQWLEAIEKDGLTWTHVSDLKYWDNAAAKLYGVKGIPASFLIDKNGVIIGKNLRGDKLEEKLDEIF